MRVIIRCAGGASRWGDFQGVPKHLVKICGEPVLHRTVRLINEITPDADVKVVVPDLKDRRYLIDGSSRTVDKPNPDFGDVDKIASSFHLWDPKDRTVVLFGDVWWTRQALESVLTGPVDDWWAWMRIVGDGGEIFAFAFQPSSRPVVEAACRTVADAHQQGRMDGIPGGWALYRTLTGNAIDDHADHGHATRVDDWTDDFDTPDDWHNWCWRYGTTSPAVRDEVTR